MSPNSYTYAADGTRLAQYRWAPAAGVRPREGGIYLLHGLSEHMGRYDHVARALAAQGWRVAAHDHRGHGHSAGAPASLRRQDDLVDDAAACIEACTAEWGRPPVVIGHSLGGLVAVRLGLRHRVRLAGLVLASPPFMVRVPGWTRRALQWLADHHPDARIPYGLTPAKVSHDRQVVAAFKADRLVHRCITGRLARFIDETGREVLAEAPMLCHPTLLLVAGDDSIVAPEGSRLFAQRAPAGLLRLRWYDSAWHELFNETPAIAEAVLADLHGWLDGQFGSTLDQIPLPAPGASPAELAGSP